MNLDWKSETISMFRLAGLASGYRYEVGTPTTIVGWLVEYKIIPEGDYKRKNRLPNTNLDPAGIELGYLAEVAVDWDADGESMPHEFVDMLKFETRGTKEKEVLGEVLSELSAEGVSWQN